VTPAPVAPAEPVAPVAPVAPAGPIAPVDPVATVAPPDVVLEDTTISFVVVTPGIFAETGNNRPRVGRPDTLLFHISTESVLAGTICGKVERVLEVFVSIISVGVFAGLIGILPACFRLL
jgi:hypothetical protein